MSRRNAKEGVVLIVVFPLRYVIVNERFARRFSRRRFAELAYLHSVIHYTHNLRRDVDGAKERRNSKVAILRGACVYYRWGFVIIFRPLRNYLDKHLKSSNSFVVISDKISSTWIWIDGFLKNIVYKNVRKYYNITILYVMYIIDFLSFFYAILFENQAPNLYFLVSINIYMH